LIKTPDDQAWLKSFYPAFMENSQTGGTTWGIPFQRSTIVLYWNKEMFKEAGPRSESRAGELEGDGRLRAESWTTRDAAGKVTQWDSRFRHPAFHTGCSRALAIENGVNLMNAAGTETYYDKPEVIEALAILGRSRAEAKGASRGHRRMGDDPEGFLRKEMAMMWTTTGNLTKPSRATRSSNSASRCCQPAKQRGSPTGGGNFYLFKKSTPAQQQAAFRFIKWITTPERAAQWGIDTGYVAVRADAVGNAGDETVRRGISGGGPSRATSSPMRRPSSRRTTTSA